MRGPDPCVCQGSVRNLTSVAGAITDSYVYTAFGVELLASGSTINPFRYVGSIWILQRHARADAGEGTVASG